MYLTPSRAPCKRKWSAAKSGGPVLLAAEWVQKKLLQHGWPCRLQKETEDWAFNEAREDCVKFLPAPGRRIGWDFDEALDLAQRIVADEKRITIVMRGRRLYLHGPHFIDKSGKVRRGIPRGKHAMYEITKQGTALIWHQPSGDLVQEAILHCAGVPAGWHVYRTPLDVKDAITKWHTDPPPHGRGWKAPGYHYLVTPDGTPVAMRPLDMRGAHCIEKNKATLGILLLETEPVKRHDGLFEDYYTPEQKQSVREIVKHHGIIRVTGHNDYAARLCPGFKVNQDDFLPGRY